VRTNKEDEMKENKRGDEIKRNNSNRKTKYKGSVGVGKL
jgi:hypothetical protein